MEEFNPTSVLSIRHPTSCMLTYARSIMTSSLPPGFESHAFTFQETNANTKIYELSAALYAFILAGSGDGTNSTGTTAGMLSKRYVR